MALVGDVSPDEGRLTELVLPAGEGDGDDNGWKMRSTPSTGAPAVDRLGNTPTAAARGALPAGFDTLMEIGLKVSVELGRARLTVRDALGLAPGHIVELDKKVGDPVDVLVNGALIARGEVVVVDDRFGVRITELLPPRGG